MTRFECRLAAVLYSAMAVAFGLLLLFPPERLDPMPWQLGVVLFAGVLMFVAFSAVSFRISYRIWPCVLLACLANPVIADPTPNRLAHAGYTWWAHRDDPNVMLLFAGEQLVGVLDPEAGSWRWAIDAQPVDMVKQLGKRPGRSTGAMPGALPGQPKAGIAESGASKPKPAVEESSDKHPDCKCGSGCKCKDGHVDPDCACTGCRCADVVGDVIDGSPRGGKDFRLGGVDTSKLGGVPRFAIGGKEVGAAEAMEALGRPAGGPNGGSVPDDSAHVRITVIGSEAARKAVVQDLDKAPSLAWLKGRSVVNDYGTGHWRIQAGGFALPAAADGVMIYAQSPDGKVLWRQDGYAGGPDQLARALRDKVPGYDPSKDPSPAKPDSAPGPPINPWWLSIPGAALLVLLFRRRTNT
jgi:hypothetical protein